MPWPYMVVFVGGDGDGVKVLPGKGSPSHNKMLLFSLERNDVTQQFCVMRVAGYGRSPLFEFCSPGEVSEVSIKQQVIAKGLRWSDKPPCLSVRRWCRDTLPGQFYPIQEEFAGMDARGGQQRSHVPRLSP